MKQRPRRVHSPAARTVLDVLDSVSWVVCECLTGSEIRRLREVSLTLTAKLADQAAAVPECYTYLDCRDELISAVNGLLPPTNSVLLQGPLQCKRRAAESLGSSKAAIYGSSASFFVNPHSDCALLSLRDITDDNRPVRVDRNGCSDMWLDFVRVCCLPPTRHSTLKRSAHLRCKPFTAEITSSRCSR